MITLVLVGIGTGNPEHLTLQAIRELNAADLILIPSKGTQKADLAELRHTICAQVVTNPATRMVTFDMPRRDATHPDYHKGVDNWHEAIAQIWQETITTHLTQHSQQDCTVALLVWGDPALYDSTLRIASRLSPPPRAVRSVPGIMSLNMLAAAHTIALNDIGAPFVVTTGRQLRDHGWPQGADTVVVMLDGECSFQQIGTKNVTIYWGAYVGMAEQILLSGPLEQVGQRIITTRADARVQHGWIMDIYLLRRQPSA